MTRPFIAVATRLRSLGFDDTSIEYALAPARDVLESPPRILFMGGFNAGKSSVVNALVGAPVAPVGATPTTALVTYFYYGETHTVRCVLHSGAEEWLTPEAYARLVDQSAMDKAAAARRAAIASVVVCYPAPVLKRATLVDSPGLGSFDPRDDETTLAHLKSADAVCWVFDIEPGPQGPLVETIRRLAREMPLAWGVLNKADLKTPMERLQVQDSFETAVGRSFRRLTLYSATQAFEVAAGRPVHPEAGAGVRLDVVDRILDALGDRPGRISDETRAEAVATARDGACRLIAAQWREVTADIAAIEDFGRRAVNSQLLAVFDLEIDKLKQACRPPTYSLGYSAARNQLVKRVAAAASPTSPDAPTAIPAGFLRAGQLDRCRHAKVSGASDTLWKVIPPQIADFDNDVPRRAREALKAALVSIDTSPLNRIRDALAAEARRLQSLDSTD